MSLGRAFPTGEESTTSPVDVEEQIRSWLADPNFLLADEAPQAPIVQVSAIAYERGLETSELCLTYVLE